MGMIDGSLEYENIWNATALEEERLIECCNSELIA